VLSILHIFTKRHRLELHFVHRHGYVQSIKCDINSELYAKTSKPSSKLHWPPLSGHISASIDRSDKLVYSGSSSTED
jgi:hypothetical protein